MDDGDLLRATARTDTTACPECGGAGTVTTERLGSLSERSRADRLEQDLEKLRAQRDEVAAVLREFIRWSGFNFTADDGGKHRYDYHSSKLRDAWKAARTLLASVEENRHG